MSRKNVSVLNWVLILGWMCFIFFLSAQPAQDSSATSNLISKIVAKIIYDHPTPELIVQVDIYVREAAHFLIYMVLGVFAYRALIQTNLKKQAFLTIVTCSLYGFTDEVHQLFVMGRSFQLLDWALDSAGGALGVVICLMFHRFIQNRIKSRMILQETNNQA